MPKITGVESDEDRVSENGDDKRYESLLTELKELRLKNKKLKDALKAKEEEVSNMSVSNITRRGPIQQKPESIARMLYYKDNKMCEDIRGILRERVQQAKMWTGEDKCIPWQWIKKATDHKFNTESSEVRMRYIELARAKIKEKDSSMEEEP